MMSDASDSAITKEWFDLVALVAVIGGLVLVALKIQKPPLHIKQAVAVLSIVD